MALQNGTVAKVKELVDTLNNGEGLTTSVDITDIVGMAFLDDFSLSSLCLFL